MMIIVMLTRNRLVTSQNRVDIYKVGRDRCILLVRHLCGCKDRCICIEEPYFVWKQRIAEQKMRKGCTLEKYKSSDRSKVVWNSESAH